MDEPDDGVELSLDPAALLELARLPFCARLKRCSGVARPILNRALGVLDLEWRLRRFARGICGLEAPTIRQLRAEFPSIVAVRAVQGIGPILEAELIELFAQLGLPLPLTDPKEEGGEPDMNGQVYEAPNKSFKFARMPDGRYLVVFATDDHVKIAALTHGVAAAIWEHSGESKFIQLQSIEPLLDCGIEIVPGQRWYVTTS